MEGLMPTFDINGGSHTGALGGAAGAFAGALFGSWFGNGWGGNGVGGRDGGYASAGATVMADTAILDGLSGISSSVQSGNISQIQGFAGLNTSVLTSANTNNMATLTAAASLGNVVQSGNASIQSSMCQGFGNLNTSLLVNGKDNALLTCQSTNAITNAIDSCCCTTQKTIMAEGCATRELIKDVQTQTLRDQLCDSKAKLAQYETLSAVDAKINASTNTVIQHVQAICGAK